MWIFTIFNAIKRASESRESSDAKKEENSLNCTFRIEQQRQKKEQQFVPRSHFSILFYVVRHVELKKEEKKTILTRMEEKACAFFTSLADCNWRTEFVTN